MFQRPQYVPRSLLANHVVSMRAHDGPPKPCMHATVAAGDGGVRAAGRGSQQRSSGGNTGGGVAGVEADVRAARQRFAVKGRAQEVRRPSTWHEREWRRWSVPT